MLSAEKILELKLKANEIRKETVKTIASIGVGHIGGSLSIADVMAVLYFDEMKVDPKMGRQRLARCFQRTLRSRNLQHTCNQRFL